MAGIGVSYAVAFTSPMDEDADQWEFKGQVVFSAQFGPEPIDIGWTTTVTRAEALAEASVVPDYPGVWPNEQEPCLNRSERVAGRRLTHGIRDALASWLA